MCSTIFILLAADLINFNQVCHTSIICFFKEACLVLKLDRHIRAQPWHLEEVNLRLTNDFTHTDILWNLLIGFKLKLRNNISLIIELLFRFGLFALSEWLLLFKDFIGDSLIRLKDLINEELVFRVSVAEVNVVWGVFVQMCFVVVVFFNCFERLNNFADINGSSVCAHFQVVVEQLQLVGQVVACIELVVELGNLLLPVFFLLGKGSLLSCFLSLFFGVGLLS